MISKLIYFLLGLVLINGQQDHFSEGTPVTILTDENFKQVNTTESWFIMFYASWCPHCKRIIPLWEDLARKYEGSVKVGALECDENPDTRDTLSIQGFPSLIFIQNNNMYKFQGQRNMNNLTDFLDNQKWTTMDPQVIPTEINYFKRYTRFLVSPKVIVPILCGVIVLMAWFIYAEEKKERKKIRDAQNKLLEEQQKKQNEKQQEKPKQD